MKDNGDVTRMMKKGRHNEDIQNSTRQKPIDNRICTAGNWLGKIIGKKPVAAG